MAKKKAETIIDVQMYKDRSTKVDLNCNAEELTTLVCTLITWFASNSPDAKAFMEFVKLGLAVTEQELYQGEIIEKEKH